MGDRVAVVEHTIVLIDAPWDGWCEERGWVSTDVTEDRARDLLAEFCADEHGDNGARPIGLAKRVWLACVNPDEDHEDQRWEPCEPDAPGAIQFYEFDATDTEGGS
jgi:hypothetical protein